MRSVLTILALAIVVAGGYFAGGYLGFYGQHRGAGTITGSKTPQEIVSRRTAVQATSAAFVRVEKPKQILFGDLHVHTTFSTDAFLWALPINGGEGVHPLADACDYARHCSAIDFWSITDHAEASSPQRWDETKESIRQCNAVSGSEDDQDLVSFIGFEWTQVGRLPEEHFGHKNVIFKDLDDNKVAARPIASTGVATDVIRGSAGLLPPILPIADFANRQNYYDFQRFMDEARDTPSCDETVSADQLPADCFESAATPAELNKSFEEQGLDPLIIPHGTSWGFYTPAGTTFDKQLIAKMRPEKQPIVEIMSGHGNSEEYRPWRAITFDEQGNPLCPPPSDNYLPSCWRAGEIIRDRCSAEGQDAAVCDLRAAEARQNYATLGLAGHITVKGEAPEDWLDGGQCRDCFLPPFGHRPGTTVQYGLAISNFDDAANPVRFNWGFIGSSDNHRARPGTGYKPIDRRRTTESAGPSAKRWSTSSHEDEVPAAKSEAITPEELFAQGASFGLAEGERQTSFWTTGGLAAVHSEGRNRAEIWDAMQRKEIYATSGPRILLWFDHLGRDDGVETPMGGTVAQSSAPTFRVRAVGAFKQKPGCPDHVTGALSADRVQALCAGECYNPSDERHLITRIEVVRIQPQIVKDEPVEQLISDPWRTFECTLDEAGCSIEFQDLEFESNTRDTLYYARAIQEALPVINGDNLRCEYDADGNCIKTNPCHGDYRGDPSDQCTALKEGRAWSSPIYVNYEAPPAEETPSTEDAPAEEDATPVE